MSFFSQSKDAEAIATETDWKAELENMFLEMNLGGGTIVESENQLKTVNLRLYNFKVDISLKMVLIEWEGDDEDELITKKENYLRNSGSTKL